MLGILKEFYVSQQNTQPMIHFQFTNLRKSLSYHGKCELLSSEEGEFHQLINLFIKKVPFEFWRQNFYFIFFYRKMTNYFSVYATIQEKKS